MDNKHLPADAIACRHQIDSSRIKILLVTAAYLKLGMSHATAFANKRSSTILHAVGKQAKKS